MRTSSPERIKKFTEKGYWGSHALHDYLAQWAKDTPSRLAVVDQPNKAELTELPCQRLSYSDMETASDRLAAELLRQGAKPGARLMVQLPNISELVICYYAASKLGLIVSPLPVQYGTHELRQLAGVLEPWAFLTLFSFRGQELAATARQALPSVSILTVGEEVFSSSSDPSADDLERYRRQHDTDANDIFTVCWTSGTTGTPKGVPRSHNMWIAICRNTTEAGQYAEGEVLLAPFPLINMAGISGFLFPAAVKGSTLVLHHPLDPPLYLKQLQDEKVNFTIAPPALLNQLAQQRELWDRYDFAALRAVGSGSAPLSPS
ncbi:MAG: class I adenylate-forming enzyme family protein, partial [Parahaliea sp.]